MKKLLTIIFMVLSPLAYSAVGVTPMKQFFADKKFVQITVFHKEQSSLAPVTLTGKIVSNGERVDGFKVFPPVIESLAAGEKQIIMVQRPADIDLDGEQRYYLEVKGESPHFKGGFRALLRNDPKKF